MPIRAQAIGGFFVGVSVILAGVMAYLAYEATPRGRLTADVVVSNYAEPPALDSVRRTDRGPRWYSDIARYFAVTLTNNGTEGISDVTLRFPGAKYWCFQPEAKSRSCHAADEVIVAGNLKPLEKATVQIWSGQLYLWNYGDIRITHSRGIASVNLQSVDLPESLWSSLKTPLAFIGVATLILALTVTFIEWIRKQSRVSTAEAPPKE